MVATAAQIETEFFDGHVRACGDINPFTDRGWNVIAERFAAWLPFSQPVDLLDVGCGTGQSRRLYASHVQSYTGVDLSREAVGVARTRHPASSWICGDACRLPCEDGSFDVVTFSSVLHHIPDFSKALTEAARVLKPGGWVFAFDPNILHPAMALFRHPRSPLYNTVGVSPNECPLSARALRSAFCTAGFRKIGQLAQSGISYRAVAPRRLNRFLRVYNVLDWAWQHTGFGRWFGAFNLTCARLP